MLRRASHGGEQGDALYRQSVAYGDGVYARQVLIARRLMERGVRYIQLYQGAGQPWDNHTQIESNHRTLARQIDQPIGALLTDLKRRGMLDDTLVIWGGEFGRTPTVELGSDGEIARVKPYRKMTEGSVKGHGELAVVPLRVDLDPQERIHEVGQKVLGPAAVEAAALAAFFPPA